MFQNLAKLTNIVWKYHVEALKPTTNKTKYKQTLFKKIYTTESIKYFLASYPKRFVLTCAFTLIL